jgi:hypothetical protein
MLDQEISCPLCTLKVHHHTHNIPPPVPISSYINPANTPSIYFLRSILLSAYLYSCLSSARFSSEFQTSIPYISYACYMPFHLFCLVMIILIVLGRHIMSSWLCIFLQLHYFLSHVQTFSSTPYSHTQPM